MGLQSIDTYCGTNIPGIIYIDYVPLAWVDASAWEGWTVAGNQVTDVTFLSEDYTWLRMPLLGQSIRWSETSNKGPNGPTYPQKLSGIIPHVRVEASEVIEETERYEFFLVRMRDRNNKVWILGEPETPLTFSTDAGTETNGANEYAIEFTGVATRRAKGFVPTLPA